jgi:hypothetical protein
MKKEYVKLVEDTNASRTQEAVKYYLEDNKKFLEVVADHFLRRINARSIQDSGVQKTPESVTEKLKPIIKDYLLDTPNFLKYSSARSRPGKPGPAFNLIANDENVYTQFVEDLVEKLFDESFYFVNKFMDKMQDSDDTKSKEATEAKTKAEEFLKQYNSLSNETDKVNLFMKSFKKQDIRYNKVAGLARDLVLGQLSDEDKEAIQNREHSDDVRGSSGYLGT